MVDPEKIQTRVPSVMDDPSTQAVARVYANAFLDAAQSTDMAGSLEEFASFLDDVLKKNPEFSGLLLSGLLNRDEQLALIDRAIAPHGSELFVNFLRVLARHDRLEGNFLDAIFREAQVEFDKRSNRKRVQIKSARALSESSLNQIREQLAQKFGFEPIMEVEVQPSLLGGLVIRVDDTVFDSSLQTRLKQLRSRLRERSLYEIQSGRDRFSSPEGN